MQLIDARQYNIKPFLKWAGGKGQLLPIIHENLPKELRSGRIKRYIEPFVGGGAVVFDLLQRFIFEEVIINDINHDLTNLYNVIKTDVDDLIDRLENIAEEYLCLDSEDRKEYYYKKRDEFNSEELQDKLHKSVLFIFLNRTCFNGLYRVNREGKFNVPQGDYKNPQIADKENLFKVSKALERVTITNMDFESLGKYIDDNSFVYFDPPYRPLNITSSFASYQKEQFNDVEQCRLGEFYKKLDLEGAKLMLSNSDPKNTDNNDNFFDDLYKGFNIKRVEAKRNINSKGSQRGKINELLILNY